MGRVRRPRTVTHLGESGDTTVSEIRWTGTHTGPLQLGPSVLPPSGSRSETLATMWHRWQDGKVVEERHHLDMLSLLSQVGALPAPAHA